MTNSIVSSTTSSINQLVISSLLGTSSSSSSSTTLDEIIDKILSSDDEESDSSDTIDDYAELTQDALDAYQEEINKGTTYNKALQSLISEYNCLINRNNSSIGVSSSLILQVCQAESISSIDLSSFYESEDSTDSSSSEE